MMMLGLLSAVFVLGMLLVFHPRENAMHPMFIVAWLAAVICFGCMALLCLSELMGP